MTLGRAPGPLPYENDDLEPNKFICFLGCLLQKNMESKVKIIYCYMVFELPIHLTPKMPNKCFLDRAGLHEPRLVSSPQDLVSCRVKGDKTQDLAEKGKVKDNRSISKKCLRLDFVFDLN